MIENLSQANLTKSDTKAHFEWVDILRGLSAFGIVLFHVRVDLWVGWEAIRSNPDSFATVDQITAWLSIFTPFLGSAVMLFFLISGFCIHYPYAKGRAFEWPSYVSRRFLRIYPPYIVAIFFSIAIELFLNVVYHKPTSSPQKIWQSILMIQNYGLPSGQIQSNPSLWSLPVEIELYLAYPVFLWTSLRYGLRSSIVLATIVSTGALLLSLGLDTSSSWYHASANFAIYWIIWCGGAVLGAMAACGRLPRWHQAFWTIAGTSLVIAVISQLYNVPQELQNLSWGSFYFFVLLWGLTNKLKGINLPTIFKPLLSTLGLISYSLYLIHFPFFRMCGVIWSETFGSKPTNFLIPLCFSMICLPVAYAFFKYVELPSHSFAKMLSRKKV